MIVKCRSLILACLICTGLFSCNKHSEHNTTLQNVGVGALSGSFYVDVDDSIIMWNAKTGVKVWDVKDDYGYGSYLNPMVYDAGTVYTGGSAGIKGYNAQTGAGVWEASFYDPSVGDGSDYRIPAFINDSLALVTSSTGVYIGGSQLYCYNKLTGSRKWQTQIDSNINGFAEFNPIPLNVNNKLVVVVKEWSSNFKICCYDPLTGKQLWQTDWNPYVSPLLKTSAGNVYSLQAATVWEYSGNDGSMVWQTTMDVTPGSEYTNSFFDDKYVYINRINPDKTYTMFVLNKFTGVVISKTPIPLGPKGQAHLTCHYQNGVLYVSDYNNNTSDYDATLYAYTFPGMQLKWSYNFTSVSTPPNPPVITDQYVVFPGSLDKTLSKTNPTGEMIFLDLNGKLVNTVRFPGTNTSKFVYVDDKGTAYAPDLY